MSQEQFKIGDMIVLESGELRGWTAVISRPIEAGSIGHALLHVDGHIIGVDVSADDVRAVERGAQGFAQLAYSLIKLGSHVIEQGLI